MVSSITITDPTTIAIIEAEAAKRGLSPADAVKQIIVAHAPEHDATSLRPNTRTETPEERQVRFARIRRKVREIQALATDEDRAFDWDAWLYDENGLPH